MENRICEYVITYVDKKKVVSAWWCENGEDIGDFENVEQMKRHVIAIYAKRYNIIFTRLYEEG